MVTTIAVSDETKDKLMDVRHKLEKKNHANYSYDKTIDFLCECFEEE